MVPDALLLNTPHYKVLIKGKWIIPGKEVMPSPTPRCCSSLKGNLQVTPNNRRPAYNLHRRILFFNFG